MHGNMWEWCWDLRDQVSYRVSRGGGWYYVAADCESALRIWNSPQHRNFDYGFRVALSPSGIPQ
jgi:formylglycine-generating enzyme required for sulfatase activity